MSANDETASEREQDELQNVSVYDFLYHDARRIGSFLAQFDDSGHLQQVRQSESAKKGQKRGYKLGTSVGVPLVGTGGLTFEKTPHDEGAEASERIYDPLWSNALTLLDYLENANLLHRDITAARIGQFVLVSGNLSMLNPGMLAKLWGEATLMKSAIDQVRKNAKMFFDADPKNAALKLSDRTRAEKVAIEGAERNAKAAIEALPHFPHAVQCTVVAQNAEVWSTLIADGLVTAAGDLSLKHGADIPGAWNLLGILDAQPGPLAPQIPIPPTLQMQHLGNLIKNFANIGRSVLGRPANAYGVTALLLFREVAPD